MGVGGFGRENLGLYGSSVRSIRGAFRDGAHETKTPFLEEVLKKGKNMSCSRRQSIHNYIIVTAS